MKISKRIISLILIAAFIFALPVNASAKAIKAGEKPENAVILKEGKNLIKFSANWEKTSYAKLKVKDKKAKYKIKFSNLRASGEKPENSCVGIAISLGYMNKNGKLKEYTFPPVDDISSGKRTWISMISKGGEGKLDIDTTMFFDYSIDYEGEKNAECYIILSPQSDSNNKQNTVRIDIKKIG